MISIIVPIYNVEVYLPKCIDSLINQSYKDIEIILIDDGSPDNSGKICDDYARKDKRIVVVHQKNAGVSAARNIGLEIAKGEFIGFCDPDDFCDEQMYEKMIHAINFYKADMVACGYEYYNEDYQLDTSRRYTLRDDEVMTRRDIFEKMSDMPPTIRHGVVTKLFHRSLIDKIRFDVNLKSTEDGNFLLDYLSYVNKAVFIHLPLYKNLVRQGSATHGGLNIQSLKDSFKVHERMYLDTIQEFPELRAHALAFLLDVCTLKYNESKRRISDNNIDNRSKELLHFMRHYIRKKAISAITCNNINWKTRVYYLLLWIRK